MNQAHFFLFKIFQEVSSRTTDISRYIINQEQCVCLALPCEQGRTADRPLAWGWLAQTNTSLLYFPFTQQSRTLCPQKMSRSKYIYLVLKEIHSFPQCMGDKPFTQTNDFIWVIHTVTLYIRLCAKSGNQNCSSGQRYETKTSCAPPNLMFQNQPFKQK